MQEKKYLNNISTHNKILIAVLIILIFILQYKLWFGGSGVVETQQLKKSLAAKQNINDTQKSRNDALEAEVEDLRQGQQSIEDHARNDLGMIKKDEQYYQFVSPTSATKR